MATQKELQDLLSSGEERVFFIKSEGAYIRGRVVSQGTGVMIPRSGVVQSDWTIETSDGGKKTVSGSDLNVVIEGREAVSDVPILKKANKPVALPAEELPDPTDRSVEQDEPKKGL